MAYEWGGFGGGDSAAGGGTFDASNYMKASDSVLGGMGVDTSMLSGAGAGGLDSATVAAANSYGSTWDTITGTVGNTLGSLGNWYGGLSNANKGLLNSALLEGTKGYMQGRAAEKERKARENFQRSMTAVPKLK